MLSLILSSLDYDQQSKFMIIYQRNRNAMYKAASIVLHDHALAEDALQEAFLAIARRIDRIRDPESQETRALCCLIVRNRAVEMLRRNSREVPVAPEELDAGSISGENSLAEAMAGLPAELRDVLLLRYDCGYRASEIGKFLGLSVSQVRRRITKAKKQLYNGLNRGDTDEV